MFYDKDGNDIGYKDHQDWWWREGDPDRYRYADINSDYPAEYFPKAEPPRVKEFVDIVMEQFESFAGRPLRSVVEFGSAGGWYLKEFQDRKLQIHGYEGSMFGYDLALKRGVTPYNIGIHDFRYQMSQLHQRFDLAICTEVAEHLEPPFHGTLVGSLVAHSNRIWFSAEPPNTNKAHLGHPGEMPLEYWIKLFAFFGYGCHMLSDEIYEACVWRGRCIFYNKIIYPDL